MPLFPYFHSVHPIGYTLTKEKSLVVDKESAPIVVEVFTRYADGETMTAIAKDMTLRGVKSKYGNRITLNIIHHMLNRRYLGEYRFRDIVHPNAFPAIISEELFERVQQKMVKNQKAPARHKAEDDYVLTTNVVYANGHTKSKLELKRTNQCKSKSRDSLWNLDFLSTHLER